MPKITFYYLNSKMRDVSLKFLIHVCEDRLLMGVSPHTDVQHASLSEVRDGRIYSCLLFLWYAFPSFSSTD